VRFLLVNNHCISDPTAGVTHSLRTIVEWLAEAGHASHVLTTARFEGRVSFTIDDHLRQQGADRPAAVRKASRGKGRTSGTATAHYHVGVVPVTLLLTRHNDETRPDRAETAAFLDRFEGLLSTYAPDQVIGCNGHPMIFGAMKEARRRGITTAFAVRGFGYDLPRYFDDVDHVFTCSQYLTDHYRDQLGLVSTPLEPPIDWSTVVAPEDARAFVTFVHPAPHKGLLLFARLADMLGARRPDIPVLVNRGALPDVIGGDYADGGGGRVLPIPDWMAHDTARLPTEQEIQPWFDAVCQLWDDDALYQSVAARARARAEARYREDLSRKRHVDYFTSLRPGAHPIRAMTRTPSDATP
jgi:glycosyltransferase involved in cell wall biosynthesis